MFLPFPRHTVGPTLFGLGEKHLYEEKERHGTQFGARTASEACSESIRGEDEIFSIFFSINGSMCEDRSSSRCDLVEAVRKRYEYYMVVIIQVNN